MEFQGRTVLVTGAAGNLGRAVAEAFASRGLLDHRQEALDAAHGPEDAGRVHVACDLRDAAAVEAAVDAAVRRVGRIDALCNIAGGFRMGEAVHETSAETWDFLMDLNVRSVLNATHAVVPRMLEAGSGRIVNVGAASALRGAARMGAYAAAKSAVIRLTESQSAELRGRGINVNCVLPSIIDTPENRRDMPDADFARWVSPRDLAAVVLFLCSDAARAVHGAALPVTGLS
jgi:NAD(P)-dependent dehydrogenase (short-subunit alcohol dehydrogenase family)